MKRTTVITWLRLGLVTAALLVLAGTSLFPAVSSADGALSEAFSTTETELPTGSLLSLQPGSKSVVEKSTTKSQKTLLGVVGKNTLVELGGGNSQVQAVVTGRAPVLASDINGAIKAGDALAVSPIAGVAMKATAAGMVVGTAESGLNSANVSTHTVKDNQGKTQTIHTGLLTAQIDVSYYAPSQDTIKPLLPSFLVSVGRTVAGKDVSGIRMVVCLLVLLLGFVTVFIMLQAGIRSGIIAIGRNPLAHKEIRRSLVDVTVTALAVLALTVLIMYVILSV